MSTSDKFNGGIPSALSISCSSKKVPLVRVEEDDEEMMGEGLKRKRLMADWLASCKDLQLEVDQDMSDEFKGED